MLIRYVLAFLFLALLALYTFSSLRFITHNAIARWTYASLSLGVIVGLFSFFIWFRSLRSAIEGNLYVAILFFIMVGWVIMQSIWSVLILADDIRAVVAYLGKKAILFLQKDKETKESALSISRNVFLQWFAFGAGALVFSLMGWGMTNRYSYRIHKHKVKIDGLDSDWKGLKIIHLSDIHSGSFGYRNYTDVKRGVDMVNAQKADIIFFTGDLVNNEAREFEKWQSLFSEMKAPMGVYSVLGNHDYGDYIQWESIEKKQANLQHLKDMQKEMGWRLLCNENVLLERNGSKKKLAVVGVENWSAKRGFPQYGDLAKALEGLDDVSPKILLSHDPSHWDAQARKRSDIKLTLSGHTHGMQFGVETPFFRWSPVQWVYKQWAGLYKNKKQWLYVNRGYGFLGYPGRVGILPEIGVIELV